ncbi:unnamed protein product, partial [Porites evermanni]
WPSLLYGTPQGLYTTGRKKKADVCVCRRVWKLISMLRITSCRVGSERGLTTTQILIIQDERYLSSTTISSYISSFSTQSS